MLGCGYMYMHYALSSTYSINIYHIDGYCIQGILLSYITVVFYLFYDWTADMILLR